MIKMILGFLLLIASLTSVVLTEIYVLDQNPWTRSKWDNLTLFFNFPENILCLANLVGIMGGVILIGLGIKSPEKKNVANVEELEK